MACTPRCGVGDAVRGRGLAAILGLRHQAAPRSPDFRNPNAWWGMTSGCGA
ncbi:hypothetical protein J6590_073091 [Homalodisca vitripennis]|nr:hypothetical protein J6590_073091 [Homalodisca vitripennis]